MESLSKGVVSLTSLAGLGSLNLGLPAQPTRTSFHTALLASHSYLNPKGRSAKELYLQIISAEVGGRTGDINAQGWLRQTAEALVR